MKTLDPAFTGAEPLTTPATVLKVMAESVSVYKNTVDNGGVRFRKLVHQDPVDIDEPLSTDSVKLIRVPIGREVEGPVHVRYENGATIIPVVEERLVIRRQLVLVEEIHVSRETLIARIPQSVTVRREELIIERQKPGETDWHPDSVSAVVAPNSDL